ncbi:MAG: DNA mismatch repair endonuclease MutL [Deltaproteobacteria bacterium]|nr:DNA mismatch repair endonuclease MutL [Deltaproteobacteria bacterium]
MENRIAVLSREVADQIAAGEVVERPASILKELLENAIDADSTELSVNLEQGGCKSIRVSDNGQGIDAGEVGLAFQRHATSKIQSVDDIFHIITYGFRGEALPSIASVARVEMISRKRNALSGSRVVLDGGKVETIQEIGCPEGTTVSVTHIFDHVPARKKFLKSVSREQAACMEVLVRIALSRPELRLNVTANGREVLRVPHVKKISDRLALVLGEDVAEHMIRVHAEKGNVRLDGMITRPDYSRANTRGYYFFVNGRFVRDPLISHAVMTGYRRVIPEKRYPILVFFIDLPPEDVDVNVHPAKTEVRFRNPRDIYDCVVEAVVSGLGAGSATEGIWKHAGEITADPSYRQRVEEALKRYTLVTGAKRPVYHSSAGPKPVSSFTGLWDGSGLRDLHEKTADGSPLPGIRFSDLDYLGQVGAAYLVFSGGDKMVVIDQHAAHERILFEKIRAAAQKRADFRQALLVPEVLSLSPSEYEQFLSAQDILAEAGIDIEPFGDNTVLLKSIPALLTNLSPKQFLQDLVTETLAGGKILSTTALKEKLFIMMACKGAVKANHTLTDDEVKSLCAEMDTTPFNATCPHGRPAYLVYNLSDLQKLFKRT